MDHFCGFDFVGSNIASLGVKFVLKNQKGLITEARCVCKYPYQAFPELLTCEENVFRALFEVVHLGSGNPFRSRTRLLILLCLRFCSFFETSFLV